MSTNHNNKRKSSGKTSSTTPEVKAESKFAHLLNPSLEMRRVLNNFEGTVEDRREYAVKCIEFLIDRLSMLDGKSKILKSSFDLLARLPSGEQKRAYDLLQKRAAKWEGLPTEAPEMFPVKGDESLRDFLLRVYGDQVKPGGKMTIAHLDVLDQRLGRAVRNWIDNHGELPEGIHLGATHERAKRRIGEPPSVK